MKEEIICGDALEELKKLPDNSVDSIVTDPPAGISFMGKDWDSNKGGKDQWIRWLSIVFAESLRVLKPGGYGLVWALPRTSHWTATALEEAGFEIRDCIYHIFGSGFPKSLDIGKAIDKLQGNKREVVGRNPNSRENATKENTLYESGTVGKTDFISKGNSEWEGFGTALKPAVECWWLIRKPLSEKTVAQNVLKWGTGGLNIDGSRVGVADSDLEAMKKKNDSFKNANNKEYNGIQFVGNDRNLEVNTKGRFPSHLIHDGSPEVLAGFPNTKSGGGNKATKNADTFLGTGFGGTDNSVWENDSGSASRFFYCAKSSKSERDYGLEGMEEKEHPFGERLLAQCKVCGNKGLKTGAGEQFTCGHTEIEYVKTEYKKSSNNHPTVKPLSLMTYLIKLITPPKGIVLDMFAGSGSTLVAAKTLGHPFIGIEKEVDYVKIAQARINAVPKSLFI